MCHNYFDPENPLIAEWRQATSLFEVATDEEIQEMEEFLLNKKRDGTLKRFMKHHDNSQERAHVCIAQSKCDEANDLQKGNG